MPDIVIRTLRVTLLNDSGYALTGYEYCARIMWFGDYRFAFEPVSASRSLTNTQGYSNRTERWNLAVALLLSPKFLIPE
ncbi:hypothetical protein DVP60_21235 [Yersinia enterocolitica]|nr:hypothetical protein [Yersinia enterocolitica]EKN6318737.1 hypothetical protein [Yersinia enterocolitica]